ncbi:hypothetical protein KCM76_13505 [Zooshikella marina]|uniref:hypothetical protein n=1 Tax=Zooshikella ganghwensis TaxID=202772 RepID=UPI001BAFFEBB|nr:hypothetical protein [Zooshikella ganghwensis]MBU2707005.1 hypothetical protein [Zooshikella ganghwensis]
MLKKIIHVGYKSAGDDTKSMCICGDGRQVFFVYSLAFFACQVHKKESYTHQKEFNLPTPVFFII